MTSGYSASRFILCFFTSFVFLIVFVFVSYISRKEKIKLLICGNKKILCGGFPPQGGAIFS